MERPIANFLPDGKRLHLSHGPIDLIIEAWGKDRTRAYKQAIERFDNVLEVLASQIDKLREPTCSQDKFKCSVSRRMHCASRKFLPSFTTPMIAVAGSVADEILTAMVKDNNLSRAYVNNGGDIAVHLECAQSFDAALAGVPGGHITFQHHIPYRGIATSGWRGRSFSLGIADSVTVIACDAAMADVAATLIANAVDLPDHPGIMREPACQLAPDNDLNGRLVTVAVASLGPDEVKTALQQGTELAQSMTDAGKIGGAVLSLQGQDIVVGLNESIKVLEKGLQDA